MRNPLDGVTKAHLLVPDEPWQAHAKWHRGIFVICAFCMFFHNVLTSALVAASAL
jgi:hypothetical protein